MNGEPPFKCNWLGSNDAINVQSKFWKLAIELRNLILWKHHLVGSFVFPSLFFFSVFKELHWYFIWTVFQGSFKDVSRKFMGVSRKIEWCFEGGTLKIFKGCFKGLSTNFQGWFDKDWRVFGGSFNFFSRSFKVISKKFKGCFREI